MRDLQKERKLPGEHSVGVNYLAWQTHKWHEGGEEWTSNSEWKRSLIDHVMLRYIQPSSTVLEIGPGAGRWTQTLQEIAGQLIIVDLSDKCIETCKQRFAECANIAFHVNDGASLSFIADETVDHLWSFDVFVHINPRETDDYLAELCRVFCKGGRGIIHHAKDGGGHGGWRSSMTSALFCTLLEKHGLTLVKQFDSWGDEKEFNVRPFHDAITVFEK